MTLTPRQRRYVRETYGRSAAPGGGDAAPKHESEPRETDWFTIIVGGLITGIIGAMLILAWLAARDMA